MSDKHISDIVVFLEEFSIPTREACSWILSRCDNPGHTEPVKDILDDHYKIVQYIKHSDKLFACPF